MKMANPDFRIFVMTGAIGVGKSYWCRAAAKYLGAAIYSSPSQIDGDNYGEKYLFFKEMVPASEIEAFNECPCAQTLWDLQAAIANNFDQLNLLLKKLSHRAVTVVLERDPRDALHVFLPLNRELLASEVAYAKLVNRYEEQEKYFLGITPNLDSVILDCSEARMLEQVCKRGDRIPPVYLKSVYLQYSKLRGYRNLNNEQALDLLLHNNKL